MSRIIAISLLSLGLTGLAACSPDTGEPPPEQAQSASAPSDGKSARAALSATRGHEASGSVRFEGEQDGLIRVSGTITGLAPGEHGFHIHRKGDCSAPDATSAGGHFNPTDERHGGPREADHHVGDLGNIRADADGRATVDVVVPHLQLHGERSIIGRAVIVHADADDLESQPSGDAGARVACGTIEQGTGA